MLYNSQSDASQVDSYVQTIQTSFALYNPGTLPREKGGEISKSMADHLKIWDSWTRV